MPAYVIVRINAIHKPEVLPRYREIGAPAALAHGGRVLVKPGCQDSLEGPTPMDTLLVEFPTKEDARRWYFSEQYQEALKVREGALDVDIYIVEGLAPLASS